MKRVIITGADGFVGSNVVQYFCSQGIEVLAIDLRDEPKNIKKNGLVTYLQMNIADIELLTLKVEKGKYDTWLQFAWAGLTGDGRSDYTLQIDNALKTVRCMEMARKVGCTRFIGAGSIMEREAIAAVETDGNIPSMSYIYGIAKMIAHFMCEAMAAEIGIEVIWPLITNTYGVGEKSNRFICHTINQILDEEDLKFTEGRQFYDFVYIDDVARAFYLIAKNGDPYVEYVIGSNQSKRLKEYIQEIVELLDYKERVSFGSVIYSGAEGSKEMFNQGKLQQHTGFVPAIGFEEGIRKTVDWIKEERKRKEKEEEKC